MARKTSTMANRTVGSIRHGIDNVNDRMNEAKDRTESLVRKNPWEAVAVAAGIGIVVGIGAALALSRDRSPRIVRKFRHYFD